MAADTRYITHTKWTSYAPTEVTYPNGRQVTSSYDALNRIGDTHLFDGLRRRR